MCANILYYDTLGDKMASVTQSTEKELAKKYLGECKEFIDKAIPQFLPEKNCYPQSIHESMHYSLFAGGKRG